MVYKIRYRRIIFKGFKQHGETVTCESHKKVFFLTQTDTHWNALGQQCWMHLVSVPSRGDYID